MTNDAAFVEETVLQFWRMAQSRAAFYICRSLARERGSADDIESDALFGLLRAARSYDSTAGASLREWVYRCVNFEIVEGYRRRLGRNGHLLGWTCSLEALGELGVSDSALDEVEDADLRRQAWSLLGDASLSACERETMRLLYVVGRSQTSVAAEQGISVSGVCQAHRRALVKLRRRLVKDGSLDGGYRNVRGRAKGGFRRGRVVDGADVA